MLVDVKSYVVNTHTMPVATTHELPLPYSPAPARMRIIVASIVTCHSRLSALAHCGRSLSTAALSGLPHCCVVG